MTSGGPRVDGEPGREAHEASPSRFFNLLNATWDLGNQALSLDSPRVMGIVNLTPDSFSDGGQLSTLDAALDRARQLVREGADVLDVGGESTRPGAEAVSPEEEKRRILPFIEAAAGTLKVPISVDTRNASVAREALSAGARIVNDVSGLKHDGDMARVVGEGEGGLVLSHMRGTPATMRTLATYRDTAVEVREELAESLTLARDAGIPEDRIVLDPGIGFAKTGPQSLALMGRLGELLALGFPLLVGPSRKSFIGELTGAPSHDRTPGTLAACVFCYLQGARIFRVHDVAPLVQALAVTRALGEASE
jgi:dihydropteroate synthase